MIPERIVPGTLEWRLYYYEHRQRYEFFSKEFKGLSILDAACGVGYGSHLLASKGVKSVVGIDLAADAIEIARQKFAHPNVKFLEENAEQMSFEDHSFDGAISFETIEHLPHPDLFLKEVHRVVKKGGQFVCSTPNKTFSGKDPNYVNPYHISEMTFPEFTTVFEKYFTIDAKYHQSHSESYRRYSQLLAGVEGLRKPLRFSKFLRLENFIRKIVGAEVLRIPSLPEDIARFVPGDFDLEPIEGPQDSHLVFIFSGRAK